MSFFDSLGMLSSKCEHDYAIVKESDKKLPMKERFIIIQRCKKCGKLKRDVV